MKIRLLGASGLRVSEFSLGAATFGEAAAWGADRAESARIFEAYYDVGGRFIDVSNTYGAGHAETIVGELAAGRRDELVIGTKFTATTRPGDPNAWGNHRKSIRQSLHRSLERLRTDHVDILWMHCWDLITPLEEVMRVLDDEIRAGTVLYVGVSNTPAWAIARANTLAELRGWTRFVGMQAEYSLVSRTPEHELIPMARHLGLELLAWSPLGGGLLAGGYSAGGSSARRFDYDTVPARRREVAEGVVSLAADLGCWPAAVAMAWLRQRPFPVIPILGARTATQLTEVLGMLDLELDGQAIERLEALSAPPPIMPREGLDMPGVGDYFHAGAMDSLLPASRQ